MNDHPQDFLRLYLERRLQDQFAWYRGRRVELETARAQLITLTAVLLVLTAVAAALAAADLGGQRLFWSVLATAFPALSTAFSAYAGLYGFERVAKLYGDAANSLDRILAQAPEPDERVAAADVDKYVARIEDIFRKEQGQWGQLTGETPSAEPSDTD